jgi:Rrf2 family protein
VQITRQADYAVRAIFHLARLGNGNRAATASIAREQRIPPTFLAKIVAQLSSAGIVRSTRGAHGGVTLAREADAISLLEVVEAIDGPIRLNECVTNPTACPFGADCDIHVVWCEAQAELVNRLRHTTFGQLVRPSDALRATS